jgi:hypothetical protein
MRFHLTRWPFKQEPIVDPTKLHLLVDLCGGGMADFIYRNAIRHASHQPSGIHCATIAVAGHRAREPAASNPGDYRSRILTSRLQRSRPHHLARST